MTRSTDESPCQCKKCWLAIAALIALVSVVAIVVVLLLPPTPGITYANYSRIEVGMTRADVESLLGSAHNEIRYGDFLTGSWRSEGEHVQIRFTVDSRVASMSWNNCPEERGALEKLRDRLPLIARRPPQPGPRDY